MEYFISPASIHQGRYANIVKITPHAPLHTTVYSLCCPVWRAYGRNTRNHTHSLIAYNVSISRIQKTTRELAVKHEATLDQIMLAFLMKHPIGIVPVLGTSKIIRIIKSSNYARFYRNIKFDLFFRLWLWIWLNYQKMQCNDFNAHSLFRLRLWP